MTISVGCIRQFQVFKHSDFVSLRRFMYSYVSCTFLPSFWTWKAILLMQASSRTDFDMLEEALRTSIEASCVGFRKFWQHSPRLFALKYYHLRAVPNQWVIAPSHVVNYPFYDHLLFLELNVGACTGLMGLYGGLQRGTYSDGSEGRFFFVDLSLNDKWKMEGLTNLVFPLRYKHSKRLSYEKWLITRPKPLEYTTIAEQITLSVALVRLHDGKFTRLCHRQSVHEMDRPGDLTFFFETPEGGDTRCKYISLLFPQGTGCEYADGYPGMDLVLAVHFVLFWHEEEEIHLVIEHWEDCQWF